jgi:RNA polymerase sigma-70 factor (ECF subfamily)
LLRSYIRRVVGWDDIVDDLLQDTYVRYLAPNRPEMTVEQSRAYLYRIATRLIYDRWRRVRTEREWQARATAAGSGAGHTNPGPIGLQRDVCAALARLAPRERAILWLAYAEGRPHREIAAIMGIGAASVRVLLFRARRKLAGILDDLGLTPEALP